MTIADVAINFEVWIRPPSPIPFTPLGDPRDRDREPKLIGKYADLESATEAAKQTGFRPLCHVGASQDISDISYSGVFAVAVWHDPRTGLRVYERP